MQNKIIVVFGATASGKSSFAIELAQNINGVVINGDSSQIYKDFPVLSNIPTPQEMLNIDHKLFAIQTIDKDFSVYKWLDLLKLEISNCYAHNKIPIIVSGNGMYTKALIDGISPIPSDITKRDIAQKTYDKIGKEAFLEMIQNIDTNFQIKFTDPQRLIRMYEVYLITGQSIFSLQQHKEQLIQGEFIKIFLEKDKYDLYNDINKRYLISAFNGGLNEVEDFLQHQYPLSLLKKIMGAEELFLYMNKTYSKEEAISKGQQKIRHYAKRQLTWFRGNFKNKNFITISHKDIKKNIFNLKNNFILNI